MFFFFLRWRATKRACAFHWLYLTRQTSLASGAFTLQRATACSGGKSGGVSKGGLYANSTRELSDTRARGEPGRHVSRAHHFLFFAREQSWSRFLFSVRDWRLAVKPLVVFTARDPRHSDSAELRPSVIRADVLFVYYEKKKKQKKR